MRVISPPVTTAPIEAPPEAAKLQASARDFERPPKTFGRKSLKRMKTFL